MKTITKEGLVDAFKTWEAKKRAGECMTEEECNALPLEEHATNCANYLWSLLYVESEETTSN